MPFISIYTQESLTILGYPIESFNTTNKQQQNHQDSIAAKHGISPLRLSATTDCVCMHVFSGYN